MPAHHDSSEETMKCQIKTRNLHRSTADYSPGSYPYGWSFLSSQTRFQVALNHTGYRHDRPLPSYLPTKFFTPNTISLWLGGSGFVMGVMIWAWCGPKFHPWRYFPLPSVCARTSSRLPLSSLRFILTSVHSTPLHSTLWPVGDVPLVVTCIGNEYWDSFEIAKEAMETAILGRYNLNLNLNLNFLRIRAPPKVRNKNSPSYDALRCITNTIVCAIVCDSFMKTIVV